MYTPDQIFKGSAPINVMVFYGALNSLTITPNGVVRHFHNLLHDLLKSSGFDNIVFYEASHAKGKYVLDDESAFFSFPENRAAYIRKYGSAPDGKPADDTQNAPPRAPVHFSRRNRVEQTTPEALDELKYSEKNLVEDSFFSEIEAFMKSDETRSAVILTNFCDMLTNTSANFRRRLSEQVNSAYEIVDYGKRNLLILLLPDINNDSSNERFMEILAGSSLRERFLIHDGDGRRWIFDNERCFHVCETPGKDEIGSLLIRYCLNGFEGKVFRPSEDIEVLADQLDYLLREGYEREASSHRLMRRPTLLTLNENIKKYFSEYRGESVPLDRDVLPQLIPYRNVKIEQGPLKKLKETKGWEGVAKPLVKQIRTFHKMYPGYGRKKKSAPGNPLLINRLVPDDSVSFPSAAFVPHISLMGPPGVGKTSIGGLIGKIYHDEGILSSGFVKVCKAGDLISENVGGTYTKTRSAIMEAQGGVLLIDEAYTLYQKTDGDNSANFKKECVDTLVQALTDPDLNFCLILCGYESSSPDSHDGVDALFTMNEGLESRIKLHITLKGYKPDLLAHISVKYLERFGYALDSSITGYGLTKLWEQIVRTSNRKTFANAREAERYCDRLIANAIESERDDKTIIPLDFPEEHRAVLSGAEPTYEEIIQEVENEFPGLGGIIRSITEEALESVRSQRRRRHVIKKAVRLLSHMLFVGRPGTGKTTIVKVLARLLGKLQITSGADPVIIEDPRHISADELKEKMQSACSLNTLLFIDEAYELRDELASILLSPMTENNDLVIVFAVYPSKLEDWKQKNDGLYSRCREFFIPDYTPDELISIFRSMCKSQDFDHTDELISDLYLVFGKRYKTRVIDPSYANARDVANYLSQMIYAAEHEYFLTHPDDGDCYVKLTLTPEHLPEDIRKEIDIMKQNGNLDAILSEFDNYVGLSSVRQQIISIANRIKVEKALTGNTSAAIRAGHFIFEGPPGTGKTTSARLLAKALYAIGAVPTDKFTAISASDMIAGYVGQTGPKTREALEKGRFGVIFIDECYLLAAEDSDAGSFKRDCMNEILLFLEREALTGETVVILGGYTDEMENLLRVSTGLASRIDHKIIFPMFTPDECLEIVRRQLLDRSVPLTLSEDAASVLLDYIGHLSEYSADFAGARDMRRLSDALAAAVTNRIAETISSNNDSLEGLSREELTTITPEDISKSLGNH